MSPLNEASGSSSKDSELQVESEFGDAHKTPSKPSENKDFTNSSSLAALDGIDPPSPLRFVAGTSKYIATLRSSGYTAAFALDSLRTLMMLQLGGIVEVSKDYMFDHSLPCRDDIVALTLQVKRKCVEEGVIVGDKWKGFYEDPATRHKRGGKRNSENKIYEDFGKLWNRVAEVTRKELPKLPNGKSPPLTVKFHSVASANPMGERESESIKPDAILELVKTSMIKSYAEKERGAQGYCVCDAACPVEVKPVVNETNRIDNLNKITHNANRYFVDDLRRRAVYGIEIQNRDFRVLTYTRTGVIASEHFDWMQDKDSLVRVIISLAFATEEELGYDPYIRRIEVEKLETSEDSNPPENANPPEGRLRRSSRHLDKPQNPKPVKKMKTDLDEEIAYEIDVGDRTFITVGPCISDSKANFFIGRATRIFQAYEKGDPTKTLYVLKVSNVSSIVAEQNCLEGRILQDINIKSRALHCETYFPTFVCYGFPQITRNGQEGRSDTSTLFLRENIVGLGFYPGVVAVRTGGKSSSSKASSSKTAGSNRLHSRGEITTHSLPSVTGLPGNYRLVTKEVGSPITSLMDIGKTFYVLQQTTHALKWLHVMGYLHRDLSLGNILYLKLFGTDITEENRGIRVILNDYDSSKQIDLLDSGLSVRTGTPEFLSNELLQELYLHITGVVQHQSATTSNPPDPEQAEKKPASSILVQQPTAILKPHPNFLHESESLFWITFYFLSHFVPKDYNGKADPKQKHAQWETGATIFPQPMAHSPGSLSSRLVCFSRDDVFQGYFNTFPSDFQHFYPHINKLRLRLLQEYSVRESSPSFKGSISFQGVKGKPSFYDDLSECFRSCQVSVVTNKVSEIDEFVPMHKDMQATREGRENVDIKFDPNKSVIIPKSKNAEDNTSDVFGPLPQ